MCGIAGIYSKHNELIKKGYIDETHKKPAPSTEKYDKHKVHLERVDKVLVFLHASKGFNRVEEHIRDVNAIRESLKNAEPPGNGLITRLDMEYWRFFI